jgi:hypothetical protein
MAGRISQVKVSGLSRFIFENGQFRSDAYQRLTGFIRDHQIDKEYVVEKLQDNLDSKRKYVRHKSAVEDLITRLKGSNKGWMTSLPATLDHDPSQVSVASASSTPLSCEISQSPSEASRRFVQRQDPLTNPPARGTFVEPSSVEVRDPRLSLENPDKQTPEEITALSREVAQHSNTQKAEDLQKAQAELEVLNKEFKKYPHPAIESRIEKLTELIRTLTAFNVVEEGRSIPNFIDLRFNIKAVTHSKVSDTNFIYFDSHDDAFRFNQYLFDNRIYSKTAQNEDGTRSRHATKTDDGVKLSKKVQELGQGEASWFFLALTTDELEKIVGFAKMVVNDDYFNHTPTFSETYKFQIPCRRVTNFFTGTDEVFTFRYDSSDRKKLISVTFEEKSLGRWESSGSITYYADGRVEKKIDNELSRPSYNMSQSTPSANAVEIKKLQEKCKEREESRFKPDELQSGLLKAVDKVTWADLEPYLNYVEANNVTPEQQIELSKYDRDFSQFLLHFICKRTHSSIFDANSLKVAIETQKLRIKVSPESISDQNGDLYLAFSSETLANDFSEKLSVRGVVATKEFKDNQWNVIVARDKYSYYESDYTGITTLQLQYVSAFYDTKYEKFKAIFPNEGFNLNYDAFRREMKKEGIENGEIVAFAFERDCELACQKEDFSLPGYPFHRQIYDQVDSWKFNSGKFSVGRGSAEVTFESFLKKPYNVNSTTALNIPREKPTRFSQPTPGSLPADYEPYVPSVPVDHSKKYKPGYTYYPVVSSFIITEHNVSADLKATVGSRRVVIYKDRVVKFRDALTEQGIDHKEGQLKDYIYFDIPVSEFDEIDITGEGNGVHIGVRSSEVSALRLTLETKRVSQYGFGDLFGDSSVVEYPQPTTLTVVEGMQVSSSGNGYSVTRVDADTVEVNTQEGKWGTLHFQPVGPLPSKEKPKEFQWGDYIQVVSGDMVKEAEKGCSLLALPSQSGGQEYKSFVDAAIVKDVNNYKYDMTGAPQAQLKTPIFAQFLLDSAKTTFNTNGICAITHVLTQLNTQLGFSGDLENQFRTVNGYLAFPNNFKSWDDETWKKVNVEFERLVPQMYSILGTDLVNTEGNKTNFFYTFAVPINYGALNGVVKGSTSEKGLHEFAETLLRTQFYSVINQSVQIAKTSQQKQTVYLTPVGGGVFNNPADTIASAAYHAVIMACNAHPNLLDFVDIKFLTWNGKPNEKTTFEHAFARLIL